MACCCTCCYGRIRLKVILALAFLLAAALLFMGIGSTIQAAVEESITDAQLADAALCLAESGLQTFEIMLERSDGQVAAVDLQGLLAEYLAYSLSGPAPVTDQCIASIDAAAKALGESALRGIRIAVWSLVCFWVGVIFLCLLGCGQPRPAPAVQQQAAPIAPEVVPPAEHWDSDAPHALPTPDGQDEQFLHNQLSQDEQFLHNQDGQDDSQPLLSPHGQDGDGQLFEEQAAAEGRAVGLYEGSADLQACWVDADAEDLLRLLNEEPP
eukprot:jgi/Ulvmu1/997/UM103_0025.1